MNKVTIHASAAVLAAGALTATVLSSPSDASASQDYDCGSPSLHVVAQSSKDKATACATAVKVTEAWFEGAPPGPGGDATTTTVQVDGAQWSCRQRQPDDAPDPHELCVNLSQDSEQVRLYS